MPERLQLTGPPEQAAAQLIADLERRGIMKRQQPDEVEEWKQLAEENPRYAPTYPVALSNELQSTGGTSLRRIKPKGNLVTDRMLSLMDRGMASKKQLKLKKRVEGKRRKVKVRGRSKWNAAGTGGDAILG